MDEISKVFGMLLQPFFDILLAIVVVFVKLIYDQIAKLFRQILYILLKIVDFFESIFDIFAGLEPVTYNGEDKTLLDVFISNNAISDALLLITTIGVVLCFVFTLYTVGKSMGTYALENKNPVSHVMKQALKSCMMFLVVPLMAYVGIHLSTALLDSTDRAICSAMGSDDTIPMSTVLFLSGTFDGETEEDFDTGVRAKYLNGQASIYSNTADTDFSMTTMDLNLLEKLLTSDSVLKETGDGELSVSVSQSNEFLSFKIGSYNYLLVYIEALVVIVIMLCGIFSFIRSMFEVLILYVTAPLFVATIPLDDGNAFRRWRELFIGKLISGFGVVFTMKIMLMLMPVIVGGGVKFTDNAMINAVIKTIFAIGSLFASFKSQHTIIQAFSPEIAMASQETTSTILGLGKQAINMAAQAGMAAATGGTSAVGSAAGSLTGAAGAGGGSAAGAAGGAFTGGSGSFGELSTGGMGGAGNKGDSPNVTGNDGGSSNGAGKTGGSSGGAGNAGGTPDGAGNTGGSPSGTGNTGGSVNNSGNVSGNTGSGSGQGFSEGAGENSGGLQKGSGSEYTEGGSPKASVPDVSGGGSDADQGFSGSDDSAGGLETGGTGSDVKKTSGIDKPKGSQAFRDNGINANDIIDVVGSRSSEPDDDDEYNG